MAYAYVLLGELDPFDGTLERLFNREIISCEKVPVSGNEYTNPPDALLFYCRNNKTLLLPDEATMDKMEMEVGLDFNQPAYGMVVQTTANIEYLSFRDANNQLLLEVWSDENGDVEYLLDQQYLPDGFEGVEREFDYLCSEIVEGDPDPVSKFIQLNLGKVKAPPVLQEPKTELTGEEIMQLKIASFTLEKAWASYFAAMLATSYKDKEVDIIVLKLLREKLEEYEFDLEPNTDGVVAKKRDYLVLMRKISNSTLRKVAEKFPLDHRSPDFQKKFDSSLEITIAFYEEFERRNMKKIANGNNLFYYYEWKKNRWFALKVIVGILFFFLLMSAIIYVSS